MTIPYRPVHEDMDVPPRGDRVRIISGKYAGRTGPVESNVYQRTVDYPDEYHNGHHVWLDTAVLVTVRQVEAVRLIASQAVVTLDDKEAGYSHAAG